MKKVIGRVVLLVVLTIVIIFAGLVGIITVVMKGPSENARDLMVLSFKESSALKWIPDIYMSAEEVAQIIENNSIKDTEEITDTSLVDFDKKDQETEDSSNITLENISGSTYKGYLMIIKDPSSVFVAPKGAYDGSAGLIVKDIADNYAAVAGINGGGFIDAGGFGNGGDPDGIVISQGELVYGGLNTVYTTAGFTKDDVFVVGNMTGQQALDMGFRDAVCVQSSYAPILIVNGEPQLTSGNGGGVNPRTAIGQTSDGSVVFLVVDGRQASSLGATFTDLIEVLLRYDVVNACCMDGGNSSQLVYKGEIINNPSSPTGPREVPNAFLVAHE